MKGSPDRSVAIADLVGEMGTVHGKGSGAVPETPTGDTGGCVGRLGNETFLAPQLITQAAHVKVDRATGVVRVLRVAAAHDSGRILNRAGADGQVLGGVVMGVGLALSEGTMLDDAGPPAKPAPARLQAADVLRRARDRRRVDRVRLGRAARLEGRR